MNHLQNWFNKLDEPGLVLHRHQQLQQSPSDDNAGNRLTTEQDTQEREVSESQRENVGSLLALVLPGISTLDSALVFGATEKQEHNHKLPQMAAMV